MNKQQPNIKQDCVWFKKKKKKQEIRKSEAM